MRKLLFASLLLLPGMIACNAGDPEYVNLVSTMKDPGGNPFIATSIAISPDNGRLAISRIDAPGERHPFLCTMGTDASGYQELPAQGRNVAWSHDGLILYFDDETNICSINRDGTNRQQVNLTPIGKKIIPKPSPDGKYLAFILTTEKFGYGIATKNYIYLYNLATAAYTCVNAEPLFITNFNWSRDSKSIFFEKGYEVIGRGITYTIWKATNLESGSPSIVQVGSGANPYPLGDGRIVHTGGIMNGDGSANIELVHITMSRPLVIEGVPNYLFFLDKDGYLFKMEIPDLSKSWEEAYTMWWD